MYYTGLTRQSTCRKALYEANAGGMNHDVYTSHFKGRCLPALHEVHHRLIFTECVCARVPCCVSTAAQVFDLDYSSISLFRLMFSPYDTRQVR
jgi:hypothetical protein